MFPLPPREGIAAEDPKISGRNALDRRVAPVVVCGSFAEWSGVGGVGQRVANLRSVQRRMKMEDCDDSSGGRRFDDGGTRRVARVTDLQPHQCATGKSIAPANRMPLTILGQRNLPAAGIFRRLHQIGQ